MQIRQIAASSVERDPRPPRPVPRAVPHHTHLAAMDAARQIQGVGWKAFSRPFRDRSPNSHGLGRHFDVSLGTLTWRLCA